MLLDYDNFVTHIAPNLSPMTLSGTSTIKNTAETKKVEPERLYRIVKTAISDAFLRNVELEPTPTHLKSA